MDSDLNVPLVHAHTSSVNDVSRAVKLRCGPLPSQYIRTCETGGFTRKLSMNLKNATDPAPQMTEMHQGADGYSLLDSFLIRVLRFRKYLTEGKG